MRLWALPTNASPKPRRAAADQARHERQGGRQGRRDADPLEQPRDEERPQRAVGLDARQEQDQAADQVGETGPRERSDAADAIDDDAGDERGRDLDERRRPDDEADLRIRDAGPGERDRQRRGEPVEAGLDGEQGEGEAEHAAIIGEARPAGSPAPAVRALAGRRVGGAGWCRRAARTLAARHCTADWPHSPATSHARGRRSAGRDLVGSGRRPDLDERRRGHRPVRARRGRASAAIVCDDASSLARRSRRGAATGAGSPGTMACSAGPSSPAPSDPASAHGRRTGRRRGRPAPGRTASRRGAAARRSRRRATSPRLYGRSCVIAS